MIHHEQEDLARRHAELSSGTPNPLRTRPQVDFSDTHTSTLLKFIIPIALEYIRSRRRQPLRNASQRKLPRRTSP
jgi:hypothetical protein